MFVIYIAVAVILSIVFCGCGDDRQMAVTRGDYWLEQAEREGCC